MSSACPTLKRSAHATEAATKTALAALDLTLVRARLVKQGFYPDRADTAIFRYRQFLFLCAKYDDNTPTVDVDEVWHAHILFTRQYADDCRAVFGTFLHHDPGTGDPGDEAKFRKVFQRTKDRIVAEFGPLGAW